MYTYLGRVIRIGKAWKDAEGTLHPANWNSGWSDNEKAAKGLVWDESLQPVPFDNRFYWSAGVPKNIDDVNEVDEDGNPILDEDGVQVVTKGLKSNAIGQVKTTAGSLLSATDWYVTRKSESGDEIPADVSAYRAAVRNASDTIEAVIEACTAHDQFVALYDVPVDDEGNPTGNAPINDWPESL